MPTTCTRAGGMALSNASGRTTSINTSSAGSVIMSTRNTSTSSAGSVIASTRDISISSADSVIASTRNRSTGSNRSNKRDIRLPVLIVETRARFWTDWPRLSPVCSGSDRRRLVGWTSTRLCTCHKAFCFAAWSHGSSASGRWRTGKGSGCRGNFTFGSRGAASPWLLADARIPIPPMRVAEDGSGTINVAMRRTIEIGLQPLSSSSTVGAADTESGPPDHLLILVHGILASPNDWKYVQNELKEQLSNKYLIYASSVNSFLSTLNGIDSAGRRLAEEVLAVVQRTPSLKRISFLGHSLGGLFARYAIAALYSPHEDQGSKQCQAPECRTVSATGENGQDIAGLEPVNFITLATPHLGVRGRQQLPFLLGLPVLEKIAPPLAPLFVGNTGRQLFLTDGKPADPPLLLRMATNCDEGCFMSALASFKERTLYANVSYDHMVGWRTSSIRRESELTKPPRRSIQGYKHIVNIINCPPVENSEPHFEEDTAKAKEAVQTRPTSKQRTAAYHEMLEEKIVCGLQQLQWRKVDVSFHAAIWPFFAHNNIHVKQEWLHHEGAGVVRHVTDVLKEKNVQLHSSL